MCLKYEHMKWRHVFVKSFVLWYRPWRSNPNKRFLLGFSGFSLMTLLNCFLYCNLFSEITKSCANLLCSLVCGHQATHKLSALPNSLWRSFLKRFGVGMWVGNLHVEVWIFHQLDHKTILFLNQFSRLP